MKPLAGIVQFETNQLPYIEGPTKPARVKERAIRARVTREHSSRLSQAHVFSKQKAPFGFSVKDISSVLLEYKVLPKNGKHSAKKETSCKLEN